MAFRVLKQGSDEKDTPPQRKQLSHSRLQEMDENVFSMECSLLYVHSVRVSLAAKKLTVLQKDIRRKQRKVARGGLSKHIDETKEQFVDLLSQCRGDALTVRTILDTGDSNPRHQVLARSLSEGNKRHRQPKQNNKCQNCVSMSQRSLELQKEKQKLDQQCLETRRKVEAMEKKIEDLHIQLSRLHDPGIPDEVTLPSEDDIISDVSDLYLHEWNDAFKELKSSLEHKEDKDIVAYLLDFIMEIQRMCKDIYGNKQVLTDMSLKSYSETDRIMEGASKQIKKGITEPSVLMEIKRNVLTHLKNWLPWPELANYIHVTATLGYINRCIDICWQMTNHNPPLKFDATTSETATLISNEYRIYAKEGKFIDFVAWPKVIVENGPLVAAGLAEGSDFQPVIGKYKDAEN